MTLSLRPLLASLALHALIGMTFLFQIRPEQRNAGWSVRVEMIATHSGGDDRIPRQNRQNIKMRTVRYAQGTQESPASDSTPSSVESPAQADAASLTAEIKPEYPALSRRLGEEGEVLVSVTIEPDGSVSAASIERTSGHDRLDSAALSAVRATHFSFASGASGQVRAGAVTQSLLIVFNLRSSTR